MPEFEIDILLCDTKLEKNPYLWYIKDTGFLSTIEIKTMIKFASLFSYVKLVYFHEMKKPTF